MIIAALILASLVLFTAWDSSESETEIHSAPFQTDEGR
jgi:hypothetical protein